MRYVEELGILPESQCGFRSGHSTADMTFTFRQLQEKCKENQQDLYAVFIDLSKAFDSVHRPGLWAILSKIGCPAVIHDGMRASVIENGERSPEFDVAQNKAVG